MGKAIKLFNDLLSGRLEKQKSAKTQESSHVWEHSGKGSELYYTVECIQIVEVDEIYMNFLDNIHDNEWRKNFLAMSNDSNFQGLYCG